MVPQGRRGRDSPGPASFLPAEEKRGRAEVIDALSLVPACGREMPLKKSKPIQSMPKLPRTNEGVRVQLARGLPWCNCLLC